MVTFAVFEKNNKTVCVLEQIEWGILKLKVKNGLIPSLEKHLDGLVHGLVWRKEEDEGEFSVYTLVNNYNFNNFRYDLKIHVERWLKEA